jgi:leader peptidase (prepilin peptidase)/N-methyltransferase
MAIALATAFAAAVGAAVGSFLNVVAYRLPRGESLVHPGSHCPGCDHAIRPYDNVPVLGWVWLRGRCRDCRTQISIRYPCVEAVTAALAVAVVLTQSGRQLALGLALVLVLVPVTLIDFDHQIIPNKITLPAAVAALVIGAITDPAYLPTQLTAGVVAAAFLLVFVLAYPRGMGLGDVKLAGVLGLFLGASVAVAIMAGVVLGTVVGAGVMARVGVAQGRKTKLPFGPFLAFGGLIALFAGPAILHWYLHAGF